MAIRLYNSLTRRTEELVPRAPKHIDMFVCGPTVYDRVHIGNARTFTFFDVVARWLRYREFDVTYIQNITDVDDRIIARAAEQGVPPLAYAQQYDVAFREDMQALGNTSVSQYARASDHIPQVLTQIKALIKNSNVYLIEGDGWYFDLTTFPDYGKLSGRTGLQANDAVSRIDENEHKRNRGDFCVWKLSKPSEPVWEDAELGAGRPGWHIEDTAITEHYFGPQYDIHGGGMDLKFPHHEAEIAQQEAASGKVPFVQYWMHAGFLEMKQEKMSKSLGNFATLHALLSTYDSAVLRFYLLSNHYRAPLDFSDTGLSAASAAIQRISETLSKLSLITPAETPENSSFITEARVAVERAMDEDFNTAAAFAAIFDCIHSLNRAITSSSLNEPDILNARSFFSWISEQFGIIPSGATSHPPEIQTIIDERQLARDQKDWSTSDSLRDQLSELGYSIDDTPYGPLVKRV